MNRIAGSPGNDSTLHSSDITRELSLSFPAAAKKVATRMAGRATMDVSHAMFHAHREVFLQNRGSQEGQ